MNYQRGDPIPNVVRLHIKQHDWEICFDSLPLLIADSRAILFIKNNVEEITEQVEKNGSYEDDTVSIKVAPAFYISTN